MLRKNKLIISKRDKLRHFVPSEYLTLKMTPLYFTGFFVINFCATTVVVSRTANLGVFRKQCYEMVDAIGKHVAAYSIEADVLEVKESILTDRGFYVPDKLLFEGVCLIRQFGQYRHASTKLKRMLHVNKASKDALDANTFKLLTFLDQCTDQIPHSAITKLIYDIVRLKLSDSWFLTTLYNITDVCDAKLEDIWVNPHIKNKYDYVINCVTLDTKNLICKLYQWHQSMDSIRKNILSDLTHYKRSFNTNRFACKTKDQDTAFRNLQMHCHYIYSGHKHLNDLSIILQPSLVRCSEALVSELDDYVQNIMIYGNLGAKLFVNELKYYIATYNNDDAGDIVHHRLAIIHIELVTAIRSVQQVLKKFLLAYNEILKLYNTNEDGNQKIATDFDPQKNLIMAEYYKVFEMIHVVTGRTIPAYFYDETRFSYVTHENCTCGP